jgi:hypothetical protein
MAAKTVESAKGDVLFIRRGEDAPIEPAAGQFHEPSEIRFPKRLHRRRVVGFQEMDPGGDGALEVHGGGLMEEGEGASVVAAAGAECNDFALKWMDYDEQRKQFVKPPALSAWGLPKRPAALASNAPLAPTNGKPTPEQLAALKSLRRGWAPRTRT